MKKTFYLLLLGFLISIFFSCQDKVEITEIKLNKSELLFTIGGTATLTANFSPISASAKMKWTTNNSSIAIVESESDGVVQVSKATVTAKSAGTAIITVSTKDGKHAAKCIVTVIDPNPELISVEGGTFTMGCTDGDCNEDGREVPMHQVTLSSYKIAKYPVTQQQWEVVMGNNPSNFKGSNLPIEMVSWYDIQVFITELNTLTGKNYRLPTEAEWEYAARGGNKSKGYKYSGSNDINAVAWYNSNSENTTHPVGTKAPNELEIYDMSGNLMEWCSDWFGVYTETAQTNPTGPATGYDRIVRGGDFYQSAYYCRVSMRRYTLPVNKGGNIGFRLVLP